MAKYAYAFKFYNKGNIFNYGTHFVLAKDMDTAIAMVKDAFPNLSISSYWKMSNDEITDPTHFNELLREHYYTQEEFTL